MSYYRACLVMTMVTLCFVSLGTIRIRGITMAPGCLEDCMDLCTFIDGANEVNCQYACVLGCEQLMGKGRRFVFQEENTRRT